MGAKGVRTGLLRALVAGSALCLSLSFAGEVLAAKHKAPTQATKAHASKPQAKSTAKAKAGSKSQAKAKGGKIVQASTRKCVTNRHGKKTCKAVVSRVAERKAPFNGAREAFYSGDISTAYRLAVNTGESWIAGLSAFRLASYSDAREQFNRVAADSSEDDWLRAGAAYWAARSAIAEGRPELATDYLYAAADKPWTFYGMIAEAQLGLEPAIHFNPVALPVAPPVAVDSIANLLIQAASSGPQTLTPIAAPAAARISERAVLQYASATTDAFGPYSGVVTSVSDVQAPARRPGFNPADYPLPVLTPQDGFTVDPAMVYAIVRQESRFNPTARSRVGAVGLMQLMPGTAAITAGDDTLKRDTRPLQDPSFNLKVGQDYFGWLLQHGVGDDLLSAVAAYNGGPGALLKTQAQLGADPDALMMVECLPAQETRAYVERVMAGYWLYRRQLGGKTTSLEALAGGAPRLPSAVDY